MSNPTFSQRLWQSGAASYQQILQHPFVTGLTDGSLSREAFRYYVVQDSHYLRGYSRALALIGSRAYDDDTVRMFALHAANAMDVERELHAGLLAELELSPTEVDAIGSKPTTTAYLSYLTAICATGSFAEAVAAVLPCYWIYREVGLELIKHSSPDPLYAQWIETYGSPEYDAVVQEVLGVADSLGDEIGTAEAQRCDQHFAIASRYEWMFWDAAHQQLDWPH